MELPSPFLGSDLCFLEHRLGQCESAGPGLSLLRSLRTCSCPERTACLLDDLVDLAWERLHSGVWSRVDSVWRDLYAWSTLALVTSRLAAAALEDPAPLVELVDLALVLGAEAFRSRLEDLMEALEREMELWRRKKVELCRRVDEAPRMAAEVDEFSSELYPTLEEFLDSMKAEKPLVIRGLVKDWPALRWNEDMEMLVESIAHRVVPVEIGSKYTDRNWAQRMMTIEQFATRFLRDDAIEQGYIAQHDLFRQIKALRNQISIPEYCCLTLNDGNPKEDEDAPEKLDVRINSWFGPRGTISPLHHDPSHNLLCQIVGSKYIKLYSSQQSNLLYPIQGVLSNTSQVDAEKPDLEKFPLFAGASSLECVLKEGDALYIPPRFWHHVRSLSLSFSVSFWWD